MHDTLLQWFPHLVATSVTKTFQCRNINWHFYVISVSNCRYGIKKIVIFLWVSQYYYAYGIKLWETVNTIFVVSSDSGGTFFVSFTMNCYLIHTTLFCQSACTSSNNQSLNKLSTAIQVPSSAHMQLSVPCTWNSGVLPMS